MNKNISIIIAVVVVIILALWFIKAPKTSAPTNESVQTGAGNDSDTAELDSIDVGADMGADFTAVDGDMGQL